MRKRPFGFAKVGLLVLMGTSPGTVMAQERLEVSDAAVPDGDPYEGVIPGTDHRPPAERRIARRARRGRRAPISIVTWPGFQSNADGSSRFFVQTTASISTTLNRSEGRIEIVFPGAGTHVSNTRRWLETAFFETPVTRARLERRRHDLVLVMYMRADVTPSVTSGMGENGYFFTYIDFGPGHYLPEVTPPIAAPPRGSVGVVRGEGDAPRRDDSSMRALDDERPPPSSGPRP